MRRLYWIKTMRSRRDPFLKVSERESEMEIRVMKTAKGGFYSFRSFLAFIKAIVLIGGILASNMLYAADISDPKIVKQNGKYVLLLPDLLVAQAKKSFPDFRIPKEEDITGIWANVRLSGEFPFVTSGDFNGDGLVDAALILIRNDDKAYKIVLFHKTDTGYSVGTAELGGIFSEISSDALVPQDYYLILIPKGSSVPMDDTVFVANNDSVGSGIYEARFIITYWNGTEYKIIVETSL